MTHLRRRASLSKITIIPQTSLGDDDGSLFSPFYISPCSKVSNDALAKEVPLECLKTSYECPLEKTAVAETAGSSEDVFQPREVEITFDYEMYYDTSSNVEETLSTLQGSYLRHTAYETGLLGCSVTAEFRNNNKRDLQTSEGSLLGVKSKPGDQLDPNNSGCIVPVQAAVTKGAECVPVRGGMTLVVDPEISEEEEENIKRGMLKILREGMLENVYVNSDIRKVSFIGTRLVGVSEPPTIPDEASNPTGISALAIGLICAGSVIAVLLAALLVRRRRKRAEDENMMRDMIFVDATVEAKEIAAQESIEFDRESRGSLADKDELEIQQDPIIEARPVTRPDESKEDLNDPSKTVEGNRSIQNTAEDVPISSSEPTFFPMNQDFLPDDKGFPVGNSAELDEYESYDVDSVDSSLASLAATNSTSSSVPYASLGNESNDAERPHDGEPEEAIDRLNAISETEPTVSEDDDDQSRSSIPAVRQIV
mmetsp:Transcript_11265/g.16559  ORF Transcript_11265/g.16559 Transcript_11265/m.16559 type:complete len:482 (+) Transcript_11265:178-1623(+)|eukprot:CAMPEP_0194222922 /NCGR_PEP_ID=MMETSP0156-20130528/34037_1 /TAXON_ID=33649 /ORGANISM="Thalassionema nitzschioides, Strain L26-B" /LENGTH=481 /DNA_ID=CAMNT_0038953895 /DNA_START=161 /DNA_END=1606 /DNA_ORIENTATION=-